MGYFLIFGLPVLVGLLGIIVTFVLCLRDYRRARAEEGGEPRAKSLFAALCLISIALLVDLSVFTCGLEDTFEHLHPSWHNEFADLWILAGINLGAVVGALVLRSLARSKS